MNKNKNKSVASYAVILDTSFMIRLLNDKEPLHPNALGYFRYFIEQGVDMYFSTISVAEYCVKGNYMELPFQNIRILPFNLFHGKEAGRFAASLYKARSKGDLTFKDRLIIPNDTKIFAQGSCEPDIKYFVTADSKSKANINHLRQACSADVEHLDIHIPPQQHYGTLPLDID